jgi:hypothetical protein
LIFRKVCALIVRSESSSVYAASVPEKVFSGDALARFASTRLDPDAPVEPCRFEREDAVVELELISTGGDPAAEARQAAMMAAHPEGKPFVTFRYGTRSPLPNGSDKPPSDRRA